MNLTKPIYIYFALTSVSLLWGTSFAAAKIGMRELYPLNLVILRFLIASTVMGILLRRSPNHYVDHQDIPRFIALGFLAITSYFFIQYTGLQYTSSINAALIMATSPLWTALISIFFKWEQLSLLNMFGIFAAFIGVSTIITNGNIANAFQSTNIIGDLLLLCNAVVWAGFTLYGREILKKYSPFVAMAYIHIFGTLLLLPFAFFTNEFVPATLFNQLPGITWTTIGAAGYLALLCSVYGYYMWYFAVGKIGATRTAGFSYLNPLFACIAGVFLLDEQLTRYTLVGGLLVIAGLYAINKHQLHPAQSTDKQMR